MINKDELIKGSLVFIDKYKRLPLYKEDDIAVEKLNDENEIELRTYRALKYVNEHFKNQDKFADYLLKEKIITYKSIADIIGYSETITTNAITKSTKNVDVGVRRQVELFFNKDYYEKELGKYNNKCAGCKKQCKQFYWVDVARCKEYSKK